MHLIISAIFSPQSKIIVFKFSKYLSGPLINKSVHSKDKLNTEKHLKQSLEFNAFYQEKQNTYQKGVWKGAKNIFNSHLFLKYFILIKHKLTFNQNNTCINVLHNTLKEFKAIIQNNATYSFSFLKTSFIYVCLFFNFN